jgi:alkanesulfonate monooxygenase SsuD/methylene tetrahydromethanopterin reductase-like flavin-dependent oxidoreductase (luciferase family)
MLSEHIVLGPSAGEKGIMGNPRDYALPGNQDPAMPWPSSLVLLSAIAAATSRLRLAACAVIAPLRHPLLLDEQLAAWAAVWASSPASFEGEHYAFHGVYREPKAWRPDGPRLWLGGDSVHPRLLRRIVRYAHGFHPLGRPSDDDMERLKTGLIQHDRTLDELELVGGVRPVFPDDSSPSPLEPALAQLPALLERGFTTVCIKPSQYVDDIERYPDWCAEVVGRAAALSA